MNTPGASWQTTPTLIEGLKRRTAESSPDGRALQASCIDCGSHAPHWRKLLGAGGRFSTAPGGAGRLLVRAENACDVCGSDAIIVTAR